MSSVQILITLLILAGATLATRAIPFLLFPAHKQTPAYVQYLGRVLPQAMVGLLVVYCLKGVSVTTWPFGLPEALGVALVVALHLWKRNTLLSIGAGTAAYMALVQLVFV